MLNEWQEFQDYTGTVVYEVKRKNDASYMGRFNFDMLYDFQGFGRVLTIIARGYLYHNRDGSLAERPRGRIKLARRALCAWCSIPDKKEAAPEREWQSRTCFPELHEEFPELVDAEGNGWLCRHVRAIGKFIQENPAAVRATAVKKAAVLPKFDEAWRGKVQQFQVPIFSEKTRGAWILRFDDVLAEALDLGPLRNAEVELPEALVERLREVTPEKVPLEMVTTLVAFYVANRREDTDWVVLPMVNFDAYFGSSSFRKKFKNTLPREVFEIENDFGISRFRVAEDYCNDAISTQ